MFYSFCETVVVKVGFILFELFHYGFHTVKKIRNALITFYAEEPKKRIPIESSVYCNTYELVENKFRSYEGETNYICNSQAFRHSFQLFASLLLTDESHFLPDIMWECKLSASQTLCATSWNNAYRKNDDTYCIEPVLDAYETAIIKSEASNMRHHFLYVEYNHPLMSAPVELVIPPSYYLVANEIFSPSFVHYLVKEVHHLHVEFDDRYTITIMDRECDTTIIQSNEYMILGKDDFKIFPVKI